MLAVKSYEKAHVDRCRSQVKAQVSAYGRLVKAAWDAGGKGEPALSSAVEEFEPLLFNQMVVALDNHFCHRAREVEGKDGNPLNEVRVLCNSLIGNDGVLVADQQIELKPERSVLGYRVGEAIALSAADFTRLADAFLAEIESKYV